ncbi:MAG: membrane protein insertion efficiency factor YidD [Planctomycetes bacterium]|nr:membrane protein insertion efficiency factor YidD [Planctomycetota bacterium]
MKWILQRLIRLYRVVLSPLLGPGKCRFTPTCSEYAHEAIEVHGAFKGALFAVWRILRCQPLCRGGYDPVPLKKEAPK